MEICVNYRECLKWVELPIDTDDLAEEFGIDPESDDFDEENFLNTIAIEDIETDLDFPTHYLDSYSLDDLNALAECEDNFHDEAVAISEAYGLSDVEYCQCRNAILYRDVTNAEELGERLVEYGYYDPIPDHLKDFIDYEKIGEDYEWDGNYTTVGFLMNL